MNISPTCKLRLLPRLLLAASAALALHGPTVAAAPADDTKGTEATPAATAPGMPPAMVAAAAKAAAEASATPIWTSQAYGVEVHGARLSASGYVIDMRYRVIDGEKARPLMDRKIRPVLVDESTGNRFYVPQPPIVGALRQTSRNNAVAVVGKTYFMLFANPDQRLKAGDKVALFLGEERFGNLQITP